MLIIPDALAALAETFSPAFRATLAKVLGLTLLALVLAVAALHRLLTGFVAIPYPWLATLVSILAGLGLAAGSVLLVAPVSALIAGFFIDGLADLAERTVDPLAPPGRPLRAGLSLALSLRFALLSLGVTALALALLLVPGVNAIAFVGANAYLSGRQYFEFVAMRHVSPAEAAGLRRRHGVRVFAAGLLIAFYVSVPLLNLLTPLFATALMVRVFKHLPTSALAPAPRRR